MTKEKILSYFEYRKDRGELVWKNHRSGKFQKRLVGQVAGASNKRGYVSVQLEGKKIKLHRLIWFLEKGQWPAEIDHIDGNKKNNRIENLRPATRRSNMQNRKSHREGRLAGSYWHKKARAWAAQITVKGKRIYLGLHPTEADAHRAYLNRLKLIGEKL